MSEARTLPERIDLVGSDDPRDVVQRAVACLAQGGVVVLPGDSSYVLAASALHPEAVARLKRIKGLDADRPLTLALRAPEEFLDWVPEASPLGLRIARKAWPGPLTMLVEGGVSRGLVGRLPASVRASVAPGSTLGLRSPAHDVVREVLNLLPGPMVLAGARVGSAPTPATPDEAATLPDLDMIVDDGPIPEPGLDTIVRLSGDRWEVARAGRYRDADLAMMAGTMLLFVCTGNTCRSPMAEALCKRLIADRLGCDPSELGSRGFAVLSAGLAAGRGQKAAAEAIETIRARGGSLKDHVSRSVSPRLVASADLIVAMTGSHRDHLLNEHPEAADRVRLLHPYGIDIDDPIGCDLDVYRETAEAIEAHLTSLLDELGI